MDAGESVEDTVEHRFEEPVEHTVTAGNEEVTVDLTVEEETDDRSLLFPAVVGLLILLLIALAALQGSGKVDVKEKLEELPKTDEDDSEDYSP